jgi:hypothetical protein
MKQNLLVIENVKESFSSKVEATLASWDGFYLAVCLLNLKALKLCYVHSKKTKTFFGWLPGLASQLRNFFLKKVEKNGGENEAEEDKIFICPQEYLEIKQYLITGKAILQGYGFYTEQEAEELAIKFMRSTVSFLLDLGDNLNEKNIKFVMKSITSDIGLIRKVHEVNTIKNLNIRYINWKILNRLSQRSNSKSQTQILA